MKKAAIFSILVFCWMISITTSCKKDSPTPNKSSDTTTVVKVDSLSLEINQFIWYGLNLYYLWTDSVTNLSASKWVSETNLNTYLNTFTDHTALFNSLLYSTRDKWSWIVNDYTSLEQLFQGITKSMGYEFGLLEIGSANQLIGYVKYVVKGSPADKAGLKRGDIFVKINGYEMTTDNYQTLPFNAAYYNLTKATISNNTIVPSLTEISLVATEIIEDPIYMDTIYNINGTKVGYLVYNQFVSNYDLELNDIYKKFKAQGVQQLILDLRYNPGGSIQSAKYMASMIYSTNTNLLLLNTQYNNNLESYLSTTYGSGYFNQYFEDSVYASGTNPGSLISSLNLSKICIIATGNTASASELVINGLKPYIPVSLIGSNTVGKYVGSITVYDYNDNGVYDSIAGAKVNPNHKYAMQPIILKIANSQGQSDYYNGFSPNVAVHEYDSIGYGNFRPLGDVNELLLKAAINNVMGYPQKKSLALSAYNQIADSKDYVPHAKEMYFFPRDLKFKGRNLNKMQKEKITFKRKSH
jgi:carboxyl-terminal processing protease